MIKTKRIYEPAEPEDGYRVLVDRLWPRGLRRDEAKLDLWLKDIAPSAELRKWFGHDPGRWEEFRVRYKRELTTKAKEVDMLLEIEQREDTLTLLFAAKDEARNQARVLAEFLLS
ncbi:MAG: DUF488 family protein [Actinobacteria bacterium]|nr:DUF488 family protein [Actinomycetota bacterium]